VELTLTGPKELIVLWATEYNRSITKGVHPRQAAKNGMSAMLTKGTLGDIGKIHYDYADPLYGGKLSGFNWQSGQQFPITELLTAAVVVWALDIVVTVSEVNIFVGAIVAVILIIAALIMEIVSLFEGKPREEDTSNIGQLFCSGHNPASWLTGIQILRNLHQNNIVLSTSDPNEQNILQGIKDRAFKLLESQGKTLAEAKDLINGAWNSSNDSNFTLPQWLQNPWKPGQPILPVLPQCPPGSHWDAPTMSCVPDVTLPPPQPQPNDPVTCTQLTGLVSYLATGALASIAAAISGQRPPIVNVNIPPEPPPIDTRPELLGITAAITLKGAASGVDNRPNIDHLTNTLAGFQPDAPTYKAILDQMVLDGVVDAKTGQLLGDRVMVHVSPDRVPPWMKKWLPSSTNAFTPDPSDVWKMLWALVQPWIAQLKASGNTILADVNPTVQRYAPAIESAALNVFNELSKLETGLPKAIFNGVVAAVNTGGQVTPDNVEDRAFQMLGAAFIVGQGLHLLAALAGYLGWPMSSIWGNNVRLIVDLLAFDEIRSALHDAYFPAAIHEAAKQHYNAKFRTKYVPAAFAARLVSRRFTNMATFDQALAYEGFNPALTSAFEPNVWKPMATRIIATAFVNQPFPTATIQAMLQDQGYKDADVATMLAALQYKSTAALANSYIEEVLTAYGEGALGDADLSDAFAAANWSTQAQALAKKRAAVIRQRNLIKETVANYKTSVYDGQITPAQFENALTTAGAQPWKVSLEGSFASMRAALKGIIVAQRAAAKELTIEENALKASYLAEYQQGNLSTAALTAALLTIPIPPATVAAIVLKAENTQVGRSRYLYGKLMSPAAAKTLEGLVKALTKQYTDTLITEPTFLTALESAGIDKADALEIVAAASAGTISLKKGSSKQPV